MTTPQINIGQKLSVTTYSLAGDDTWNASSDSLPSSWTCTLVNRSKSDLRPGVTLQCWVLRVLYPRQIVVVTNSDFGFLPISDRKRPLYIKTLQHFSEILRGKQDLHSANADAISELKGMYSRCWKQDQWDWCAVYTALGSPDYDFAKYISILLSVISACIRCNRISIAGHMVDRLRDLNLTERIESAGMSISQSAPRLTNSRPIRMTTSLQAKQTVAELIQVEYSKQKVDDANRIHSELLAILRTYLEDNGHVIESNDFIDAFARLRTGPAIFEAKSINDVNEMSQIRQGLSQLYEYRFRHQLNGATLWLLLSRPPSPKLSWLVEYIEVDRNVRLLWIQNGNLSGPSFERLTESSSHAERRDQSGKSIQA